MDAPPVRVLVTAFAVVPGSSPHAAGVLGLAAALHGEIEIVTVKTETLPHMERYGDAKMFRVPVGVASEIEQHRSFCRAVGRQIESQPYDVVHVRGPLEGLVAAQKREVFGFKLVYEVASFPDEAQGPLAEAEWADAHGQTLEVADLVIVHTEAATRSLAARGYGAKVAVVAPGVDIDVFDSPGSPGVEERLRLLYLGSFAADRDVVTLLGAVRRLAKDRPMRVLVAGEVDPERRQRFRRMVDDFGLSDSVEVRGEPSPALLPKVIEAADVCLATAAASPRFQEHGDLPMPLLEYLACRRPVVAAGVPGVAEVLRDEREGLLYPPGDEAALADSVLTLLRDPSLRTRVVDGAYERVRRNFSLGARRRRMAEVYDELVPGSQQHDPWRTAFGVEGSTSRIQQGPGSSPGEEPVREGSSPTMEMRTEELLTFELGTPGMDTSPGTVSGEKTTVSRMDDTEQVDIPKGPDDPKTGPIRLPPQR